MSRESIWDQAQCHAGLSMQLAMSELCRAESPWQPFVSYPTCYSTGVVERASLEQQRPLFDHGLPAAPLLRPACGMVAQGATRQKAVTLLPSISCTAGPYKCTSTCFTLGKAADVRRGACLHGVHKILKTHCVSIVLA